MQAVGAEGYEREDKVERRLLLLGGHLAHGGQLLLSEGDIDGAAAGALAAVELVAEPGDEEQDEARGDEGGLQPARPGDALAGGLGDEGHAYRVRTDGGIEQPGVRCIRKEVGEHYGGVALVLTAFVAHALADAVAHGADNGAARRIRGDHQRENGVGNVGGVVCHEFGLAHLDEYPVGDALAQAGVLDDDADEARPETQPPAGAAEAGHDARAAPEEDGQYRRGDDTDEVLGYRTDYPHDNGPDKDDHNALALPVQTVERNKGHQCAQYRQYRSHYEAGIPLFLHFLHSLLSVFGACRRRVIHAASPGPYIRRQGRRCPCAFAITPKKTKRPTAFTMQLVLKSRSRLRKETLTVKQLVYIHFSGLAVPSLWSRYHKCTGVVKS